MDKRFSFASIILSYFLVGGGVILGLLIAGRLHIQSELFAYGIMGVGALLGGFLAARASAGSTIIEPTIGALLFVATIVASIALTDIGKMLWNISPGSTGKAIGGLAAAAAVGGLLGAFISEKMFGESSQSTVPWVIYTAVASLGASWICLMLGAMAVLSGKHGGADDIAMWILIGMAVGCLLCGLAAGASARERPLLATAIGCAIGTPAFVLVTAAQGGDQSKAAAAIAVFAVGGAIVGLIGAAIGWATVGKNAWTA